MKLLALLFLLLFSASVFAQSTIDFESTAQDTGWTVFANGATNADSDFVVVPNPDMSGLNSSANVAQFIVPIDGAVYAGAYSRDGYVNFVLTADNDHPTVMVWKDVSTPFDLKLEGSGGLNHDVFDTNKVTNQWVLLSFDYSANIGDTVKRITIIPDFPATRTVGSTNYIDNIEFVHTTVPVELTSFRAIAVGNNVELHWNTATETNNSGFEVQRSADNVSFAKIAFISGHGTSTKSSEYSFTDKNVSNHLYYRLKQLDMDGTYKYSKVVEVNISKQFTYSLNQNYPNPFNPSTVISYSVPEKSFVSLKVYNVLGKEVASLVNNQEEAGIHQINFNAMNLSSGIYFYTIRAGNFTATKKLMLLK